MKQEAASRLNWRGPKDALRIYRGSVCQSPYSCQTVIEGLPSGFGKTAPIQSIISTSGTKTLLVLSKEKGCEIIKDWMKGIRRHVYWCTTSTKAGFEALIIAKWNSFMRHVCNKHDNHPDPLYKKCHHGDLEPRKWIKVGK